MLLASIEVIHNPTIENFEKHLKHATLWRIIFFPIALSLLPLPLVFTDPRTTFYTKIITSLYLPLVNLAVILLPAAITFLSVRKFPNQASFVKLSYGYFLSYFPFLALISWIPVTPRIQAIVFLPILAKMFFLLLCIGLVMSLLYSYKHWKFCHEGVIGASTNLSSKDLQVALQNFDQTYKRIRLFTIIIFIFVGILIWALFFLQEPISSPLAFPNPLLKPDIAQEITGQ